MLFLDIAYHLNQHHSVRKMHCWQRKETPRLLAHDQQHILAKLYMMSHRNNHNPALNHNVKIRNAHEGKENYTKCEKITSSASEDLDLKFHKMKNRAQISHSGSRLDNNLVLTLNETSEKFSSICSLKKSIENYVEAVPHKTCKAWTKFFRYLWYDKVSPLSFGKILKSHSLNTKARMLAHMFSPNVDPANKSWKSQTLYRIFLEMGGSQLVMDRHPTKMLHRVNWGFQTRRKLKSVHFVSAFLIENQTLYRIEIIFAKL